MGVQPWPNLDRAEEVESTVFWNACGPLAKYSSCSHQGLWQWSVPKCESPSAHCPWHLANVSGMLAHFEGCTITCMRALMGKSRLSLYSLWYGCGLVWSHHMLCPIEAWTWLPHLPLNCVYILWSMQHWIVLLSCSTSWNSLSDPIINIMLLIQCWVILNGLYVHVILLMKTRILYTHTHTDAFVSAQNRCFL